MHAYDVTLQERCNINLISSLEKISSCSKPGPARSVLKDSDHDLASSKVTLQTSRKKVYHFLLWTIFIYCFTSITLHFLFLIHEPINQSTQLWCAYSLWCIHGVHSNGSPTSINSNKQPRGIICQKQSITVWHIGSNVYSWSSSASNIYLTFAGRAQAWNRDRKRDCDWEKAREGFWRCRSASFWCSISSNSFSSISSRIIIMSGLVTWCGFMSWSTDPL